MDKAPQEPTSTKPAAVKALPRLTYKVEEVATILGVSKMSVRRLLKNGRLKAVRSFRIPLVPASELEKFAGGAN